jgi:hypothetical protein
MDLDTSLGIRSNVRLVALALSNHPLTVAFLSSSDVKQSCREVWLRSTRSLDCLNYRACSYVK